MNLVEKLKRQQTAETLKGGQLRIELEEKEKLQRQAAEEERRAKRKEQAEKLRNESGINNVVEELGNFFATPTIPIVRTTSYDGLFDSYTEYVARGSYCVYTYHDNDSWLKGIRKDPDSIFDVVMWDSKYTYKTGYDECSEKYIAVETSPDGTISFHADLFGCTTIKCSKWKTEDKAQLFEKAIEKAYNHPGIKVSHLYRERIMPGMA